jgi:hypothetical protein
MDERLKPVARSVVACLLGLCILLAGMGSAAHAGAQLLPPADNPYHEGFEGITVDRWGNVYVSGFSTQTSHILKFSPAGKRLAAWSLQWTYTPGGLGIGRLATDHQGNVYLANEGLKRVQKFSSTGKLLSQWSVGLAGSEEAPAGITLDSHNTIYVAEYVQSFLQKKPKINVGAVVKVAPSGKVLARWTVPGTPIDVAADTSGNVYAVSQFDLGPSPDAPPAAATDFFDYHLVKFSPQGKKLQDTRFLDAVISDSTAAVTVARNGALYVTVPACAHDAEGGCLFRKAAGASQLTLWTAVWEKVVFRTEDLAVAPDGSIFVPDQNYGHSRIVKLSPSGATLATWP